MLPPAETAARAERILAGLETAGGFEMRTPPPIDEDELLLVHEERYLTFLRTAHERWRRATGAPADGEAAAYIRPLPGTTFTAPTHVDAELGIFSNDVDPILEGTWQAALSAASCAVAAAREVHAGATVAYALTRPPGHHAAPATFGGYCYLNNTALAAAWLATQGARVAVVDVDAHHGNGTQAVFWDRGDVLTTSIHGTTEHHFPFYLGSADERGEGEGVGANLNLPLPTGTPWIQYRLALDEALEAVDRHRTDYVIVALGVDTHRGDGVLGLDTGDYSELGAALDTGLPTVFVQEGGYGEGVLESAVADVLQSFA